MPRAEDRDEGGIADREAAVQEGGSAPTKIESPVGF
jgi:hypothetical protein